MKTTIYLLFYLSIAILFPSYISAQNASRLIATGYYSFNTDSNRVVFSDSSAYIYNSNSRGINHYLNGATEDGYNLGEISTPFLFDTGYYYHSVLGTMNIINRSIQGFGSDNFQTSSEVQNSVGGVFTPASLYNFTRNNTGRLTAENHSTWSGTAYGINTRTAYLYNANNKLIRRITEDSIGGTNNFNPTSKDTTTYDSGNRIFRQDFYRFANNIEVLSGYIAYQYDAQGRQIHKANRSIFNGSTVGAYDDSTVYDGAGRVAEEFSQSDTLGNFSYWAKYFYGTSGDNDSAITYANNTSNTVFIRNLYTYDSQHRMNSHTYYVAGNSSKEEYEYNSFSQITVKREYNLGTSNNWILNRITNNYYETYNDLFSSTESIMDGGDIQLYPNPSHGDVELKINETNMQNNEVRLYDLAGKNVYYARVAEANNALHLSGLQKGCYVVVISNGTMAYSRKLVVQ